jgi:spectinomycin phosphotransferase
MRDRPEGLSERELTEALARGWHIKAATLRYAPVGAGSYHWVVDDSQAGRWFVTVDDLDQKSWLGGTRATVRKGLRAAMDTAVALHDQVALRFVVAPVPTAHGETTLPLSPRYDVSVFPFVDGTSGEWGETLPAAERGQLAGLLAALHRADPAGTRVQPARIGLSQRGVLEQALGELGQPWRGGPFAEPARALLASRADRLRRRLQAFDFLAGHVTARSDQVITHGEPHPGNVMQTGDGLLLIDWDTVGLAVPERDLWLVLGDDGDEALRYGRSVDPDALGFYRLRWALDDLCCFLEQFRAPHRRTPCTEKTWQNLAATVATLGDHDGDSAGAVDRPGG